MAKSVVMTGLQEFLESDEIIAIVISRFAGSNILHAAIAYKIDEDAPLDERHPFQGNVRHIHFMMRAENGRLRGFVHQVWHASQYTDIYYITPDEYDDILENIVANIEFVLRHRHTTGIGGDLAFSLIYNGCNINDETGEIVFDNLEEGFTCATFVLFFLQSFNLELINFDGWINDNESIATFVRLLQEHTNLSVGLINILLAQSQIDRPIITPQEVFSAGSIIPLPANHESILRALQDFINNGLNIV